MAIDKKDKKIVKNGVSYYENGWLYISIKGNPKERGIAYGKLIVEEFKEIQRMVKFMCMDENGKSWQFFIDASKNILHLEDTIKTHFKEFYEEMEGIAEGINSAGGNTTLSEIIAWNNIFLLTGNWYPTTLGNGSGGKEGGGNYGKGGGQPERCSAFICTGKDYTTDGKIVCGHNNFSNFIDGQFAKQVLDIQPTNGGHRMLIQGFIGFMWSGTDFFVSSNGIFGSETTIGGFNQFENNYPISCRIRQVMQYAKSLDDCDKILRYKNSGDYANSWIFGDTNTNEIMRIELGLKYNKTEKKSNGYFIGFNAPYDPELRNLECANTGYNDVRRHQGARKVRLEQLMAKYKGRIDLEVGKLILSDHYDVYLEKENPCSRTVCSHYDEDAREFVSDPSRPLPFQPRGAIDGNLIDTTLAKKMSMLLKFGRSCEIPFIADEFFKKHSQWIDLQPYLKDRLNQPWTVFTITELTELTELTDHSQSLKGGKRRNNKYSRNKIHSLYKSSKKTRKNIRN
jgi:hypothetical protein